uniref:Uncharacterized protein n=1 Tax=Tanacetum cinerariifolium TaxID=118510 RepID=A0A6L2MFY8_TANCI|nr:hypothetical protein [Tanacetum cinerariifolium]
MAIINDVPQLVDKKGGSYAAIAPKLEPIKFNKWKKRMLCYLARMEPYYLKCIKDGPFMPKTAEGDAKPDFGVDVVDFKEYLLRDYYCWLKTYCCWVIDGVVQPVAPTTAEQRLAGKNELKARGTLLMALPNKHQLKFNIHKDAKSLMEAIEQRFGGNKETKKASEAYQPEDINLKFLRCLPAEWRTHTLMWRNKTDLEDQSLDDLFNSLKIYKAEYKSFVSALPNVDTLSDAVIYSFFMAMLTMRAMRFLQRTGRNLGVNGTTSIGFDMSKVECYNCHRRRYFARECRSPKDTRNKEAQRRNVPAEEEPTNYTLMAFTSSSSSSCDNEVASCSEACLKSVETRIVVYQQNENVFEEDIKLLKLDVMLRDNALIELRKKFKKAEKERNEFKLKLEKFQTSLKNLSQLLASQTSDKTRLGYDTYVFYSTVFDCDKMFSSEFDVSMPTSPVYDRYKSREGYHAVPPPYTRTFMPSKLDLVFHDAPTVNETVLTVFDSKDESEGEPMPTQKAPSFVQTLEHVKTPRPSVKPVDHPNLANNLRKDIPKSRSHRHSWNRKACFVCKSLTHLIKDYDYYEKKMVQHPACCSHIILTRSKLVPLNAARSVTTVVPQNKVQHQRPTKHGVTKAHSLTRRPINLKLSPFYSNFHQKVTTVKTTQVNAVQGVKRNWSNPQHALKDKGVIDSGCSRHMTWNISYLSDFEEINGGYVAFGGNPKGGKITGKGKIRTGKLDFDDVYFVKELKFNLFSVSQMCDKKKSVLFTDTGCIVLSLDFKLPDDNHVLLRVPRENNMYNVDLRTLVLVTKPHIKTPYELLLGRTPSIRFMRPFGCPVTILNTLDPLGKFDGKADEGFLVGYSVSSKSFRVFNNRTRIVQETLHINFLENQPNVAGSGPTWLFDIDSLTQSMNYQPVVAGNQPNSSADPQNTDADTTFEVKEIESSVHVSPSSCDKTKKHDDKTKREEKGKSLVDAVGPSNNAVSSNFELGGQSSYVDPSQYPDDPDMPALEDITYSDDEEDVGAKTDFSNLETNIHVSPIPTTRVHKDHPVTRIIGDLTLAPQTRSMTRIVKEQGGLTQINDDDFHTCMFACFLSQEEPKRVYQALKDPSWIEAMQEELLQFKMQKVYVCQTPKFEDPDYPDKVYKVVKALYGLHQALRAWYETLANYKIDQTLFIKKQKGDILLVQVFVDDIIFGSTNKDLCKAFEKLMKDKFQMSSMDGKSANTPIDTEKPLLNDPDGEDVDVHTYRSMIGSLMYLTSSRPDIIPPPTKLSPLVDDDVGEEEAIRKNTKIVNINNEEDEIFFNQSKYIKEMLKKFGLKDSKPTKTPRSTEIKLTKDDEADSVNSSKYQENPKTTHLEAAKRIFRYIRGTSHLRLWYPKGTRIETLVYADSDHAGDYVDRKSTSNVCTFMGCCLTSWDKIICDLDKTPDLSQQSLQNCPKCGNPVDGHYCQGCALLREKFKEDLFISSVDNGILPDSSEPSNDDTNVAIALQEPFVVNQDPDKNSSQILIIPNPKPFNDQSIKKLPPTVPSFVHHAILKMGIHSFMIPHLILFMILLMFSTHLHNLSYRYGHYCTPQVPFVYPKPCYNLDFNFPQDYHDFQQQYLCCENYEVTHEAYQCQPMNEDYYHEQNSCYDPNSFGFDQFQPHQYTVNHPIFNVQNDLFDSQNKLMEQLTSMCDMVRLFIQKKEEKQIEEEQVANAQYWKIFACYDDDDNNDNNFAITPKELDNSLSMGDEHLDTVLATKLDEFIKSSVENLVPNPRELKGEYERDVLACEVFTTFSNILFDFNYAFYSIDDQSFSDEDSSKKIYSNPLFTQSTTVPNHEKSPDLLSHQGHEAFQPSAEYPMTIYRKNTPILDVLLFHFYPP